MNNLFSKQEMEGIEWMTKYNQIRRKFAHTVKKPPTVDEVLFAEEVRDHVQSIKQKYFTSPERYLD